MGGTTKHLANIFPKAKFVGVDSSGAMLEQAHVRFPKISFLQQSLEQFNEPFDFIFQIPPYIIWIKHSMTYPN